MNKHYDVFISGSTGDRDWTRQFASALSHHGLRVFRADESLPSGRRFEDSIRAGLSSSSSVIVVLDSSTTSSPWTAFEVGAALESGKRVVPVIASDVRGEEIPQYLRSFQRIAKEEPELAAERFLHVLKSAT